MEKGFNTEDFGSPGEVMMYAVRTDTVRRMNLTPVEAALPRRAARARRFRFEKDRLLCLGAGVLMTEALGIRNEEEIRYGENGKPFLPGGPAFNLSHSGEWCVLATGGMKAVGVDVEEINPAQIDLAPAVYTNAEQRWMAGDPVNRFFRLWTWKESVMKVTGLGMSLEPRQFEVLPFAERKPVQLSSGTWYALESGLEGYRLSVCADEPIDRIIWKEML